MKLSDILLKIEDDLVKTDVCRKVLTSMSATENDKNSATKELNDIIKRCERYEEAINKARGGKSYSHNVNEINEAEILCKQLNVRALGTLFYA